MAEMEEKFQEILGNEDAMSQIMSLAQSLNHDTDPSSSENSTMDFGEMMGGLDPKMMAMATKLMGAYQSQHRSLGLMTALRPLVSEDRHKMMERLATATRLAKVATCVLDMLGEKGEKNV